MNDTRNLILAVVLSVAVLLGWTWAANKFFPTANPPSTKVVNGERVPAPPPAAQPSAPATPKALKSVSAAIASSPRISIRTLFAYREKNTAAWPAEFAPPTMKTSWSAHSAASVIAEP